MIEKKQKVDGRKLGKFLKSVMTAEQMGGGKTEATCIAFTQLRG